MKEPYLLVTAISYFLTITVSREKRGVKRNCRRYPACKQTRSHKVGKQKVLRLQEQRRKLLSHSDSPFSLVTPSPHRDYKDVAALRGPSNPPIPIREIRVESRQVKKSFLAKQPKHHHHHPLPAPLPPSSSWQSGGTTADPIWSNIKAEGVRKKPKWQTVRGSLKDPTSAQTAWTMSTAEHVTF